MEAVFMLALLAGVFGDAMVLVLVLLNILFIDFYYLGCG
jgi:hypothetical protein